MSSLASPTLQAFRPARLAALLLPAALLSACETIGPVQVLVPEEVQRRAQLCALEIKRVDGQERRSACGHQAAQTGGTSSWTDTDSWDLGLLGQRETSRVAKFNLEFTPAGGPTERWRCETNERERSKHVAQVPLTQGPDRELSCTHEGPQGTEQLRHSSLQGDTVIWSLGGQEESWTMVGFSAWRSGAREGSFVLPMAWCLRTSRGQWMSCHERWRRQGSSFWMMPLESTQATRRAALLALAPLDLEPLP